MLQDKIGKIMARSKTRIRMSTTTLRKRLMKELFDEQTNRLVQYAMSEIIKIGNEITTFHSANHMDDTGNLLDSLCWGVAYKGVIQASGFYRTKQASTPSTLHDWSKLWLQEMDEKGERKFVEVDSNSFPPVNGHELADAYINKYGKRSTNGWKVFFAILAPYWGYWEKGFTLKHGFSRRGGFTGATHMRFAVMTQYYDQIKRDIKPARMYFGVSVAKYTSMSLYKQAAKSNYGRGNRSRLKALGHYSK